MPQEEGLRRVTVVGALSSVAERQALGRILEHTKWQLRFADGLQSLRAQLEASSKAVIVADRTLADGSDWRDVVNIIEEQRLNACVIVAERNADDDLWAEVLHVGAYDLLMKPFRSEEVFHAISAAWRSLAAKHHCWQSFSAEGRYANHA